MNDPVEQIDNRAAIEQAVRALHERVVLVGIPETNNQRPEGEIGNAALGYIHEFGSPAAGIPARPWLAPGVESVQERIAAEFRKAAEAALQGNDADAKVFFGRAGQVAVNGVVMRIRRHIPPPLRPATIAARRRRSPGSSYRRAATSGVDVTPLYDTHNFVQAITFVVKDHDE